MATTSIARCKGLISRICFMINFCHLSWMAHFELCNVETLCLTILMALATSEVERKLISVILTRVSSGNGRIVSRMGIRLGVY